MTQKKAHTPPKTQVRLIPDEKPPISNDSGTTKRKKTAKEQGKLYQDQIYGPKVLTPLAVEIMDTPEFQRLEGIKQLGFANATYRGAEHTRLAHSVGTYFITKTIMRRIVQNHERFDFPHPGENLDDSFRFLADNAYDYKKFPRNKIPISPQSKWRGLTEVVSIAALLHDITHVPFGHTLEDEFNKIYSRHDRLAGSRLYRLLFDIESDLKKVFDKPDNWIQEISNDDLRELIYVILSWKEEVDRKKLT